MKRSKKRKKTSNKQRYIKTVLRYTKKAIRWAWEEFKLLLLIILGAIVFFNWLDVNIIGAISKKVGFTTQDKLRPLEEDEEARLTVNTPARRVHLQTKDGETKTYKGVRKVEATQLIDGSYKIKARQLGLALEPGIKLSVGDGLSVGPDVEFMYWKNFALSAGFTVPVSNRRLDRIRGNIALDYMPGINIIPNTGLFVGIDTNKAPIAGVRIRF